MRSMASKTEFRVLGAQRTVVVWYRLLFDTIQVYLSVLLYESKESSIDSSRMISNFPKSFEPEPFIMQIRVDYL